MYKSSIRDGEIQDLMRKVLKGGYGSYMKSVLLRRVRGFIDEQINFDFPVTALVGPNGGGKTTILGAAGCLYMDIRPRTFFAKSGPLDESMADWQIEYVAIDKTADPRNEIRRSITFKSLKWDRKGLKRKVEVFGVSRTVPANERKELANCARNTFSIKGKKTTKLTPDVQKAVLRILGKDVSQFTHVEIRKNGNISLLSGKTPSGVGYSEFHFGAGESSVIRMVMTIETLDENSLVLIEEIENGLHPMATIAMVEYLIDVAIRKKIQSIFTTHSNEALTPLPPEAIWASINHRLVQGKLDIRSLRAMTPQISSRLVVFVEDEFAKVWVSKIMESVDGLAYDAIEFYAMQGDGSAVKVHRNHGLDPSVAGIPSVCFIDGDSKQVDSAKEKILRLPGEMPEAYIFNEVVENIIEWSGTLAVALHKKYEDSARVIDACMAVRGAYRDAHTIYSDIGKRLGFIPEEIVRSAFLMVWTQSHQKEIQQLLAPIESLLPMTKPEPRRVVEPTIGTKSARARQKSASSENTQLGLLQARDKKEEEKP